jgi:hypothetical protein
MMRVTPKVATVDELGDWATAGGRAVTRAGAEGSHGLSSRRPFW